MANSQDTLMTIAEELTTIKKLLVVALLNSGVSQQKLAESLGVNQSSISRMMSKRGK